MLCWRFWAIFTSAICALAFRTLVTLIHTDNVSVGFEAERSKFSGRADTVEYS